MPELPEVEIIKRHFDATARGRRIGGVSIRDRRVIGKSSCSHFAARLKGARFGAARRHGKYLLVALGKAGWLVMHFGMNGSLRHFRKEEDDPPYDRLRFDLGRGHHLAYVNPRRIGRVELVADADAFLAKEKLGPDVLDARLRRAEFADLVALRARGIKSVLMDQTVMAGIGNLYSDEILFQSRIHPLTPAHRLDRPALDLLFRTTKSVLRTAIRCGAGSERMLDKLPRIFLLRRRRKGERCPRCDGAIATLKLSGRTAYYCPCCQRVAPKR